MSATAIHVDSLTKRYRLGRSRSSYRTLRESLVDWASRRRRKADPAEEIWALREVSFGIGAGEAVGIIGRNGAGKSTLLKILSRITVPTSGRAEIRGRVGSLLEVGTGFHPELSGRENVFLNGAILGMRKREIARKFDQIVAFAELERFMDTAVKHYSSGMYMRLAFAVAAHLETEILLIDEVLAVGDVAFQRRCLGKMEEVASQGRTVLFVSHNMTAVAALCQRAIWIDDGRVGADGPADEVTGRYLQKLSVGDFQYESSDHGFAIRGVALKDADGRRLTTARPGEDLTVEISFEAQRPIASPYVTLVVQGVQGSCFTANMLLDGQRPAAFEGRGVLRCRFQALPLLPQAYTLKLGVAGADGKEPIVRLQEVASFAIEGGPEDYGFAGDLFHRVAARSTSVVIPYQWTFPDGSTAKVGVVSPAPSAVAAAGDRRRSP